MSAELTLLLLTGAAVIAVLIGAAVFCRPFAAPDPLDELFRPHHKTLDERGER